MVYFRPEPTGRILRVRIARGLRLMKELAVTVLAAETSSVVALIMDTARIMEIVFRHITR
jgi:hypothetical protein